MKALFLSALCLVAANACAGERVPSWLRVVDWDGQVFDFISPQIDSLSLCPASGGKGQAVITLTGRPTFIAYEMSFYNGGNVTNDPDTTGDQLVLIEGADIIFGANFDDCAIFDR